MEKEEKKQFRYGLLGKDISYSFSKGYFAEKFEALGLKNHGYENFDIPKIEILVQLLKHEENLKGFNVTIPYKEAVLPYLSEIDTDAEKIGAVNTVQFTEQGLKGYNTDAYGFQRSLEPFLKEQHTNALVLGTGGASKAILFVLKRLGIETTSVSRSPDSGQIGYAILDEAIIRAHQLIINSTPLGTYPNIEDKPPIPYKFISKDHLLFDVIYNPAKTAFLREGESQGATGCNGLRMLELQAEKAWEIWNGS
ncbi:shikimate dehydrogenase [Aggregatimonas sangjinii]|uniref:Shikimate dehydrogenase n=1 Tax=Aggregatimonas sangjinii TaxID=2583587 RepID=A0A5B7SPM6_9FLAO|nr:shikimate dehydrogenase [Aggregatimonas sangjinii]QCX00536.1 shikimate dehydrogenase [Aggregatimonas sangjinii]